MQIRGGTGVFTGPPPYVWISNQLGNTGVLIGEILENNTTARPFHPDTKHYWPAHVTGEGAASYGLNVTDQDFKFPQVSRSNIAVDRRLPGDLVGTVEVLHNRDINGIYYINANCRRRNLRSQEWTTGRAGRRTGSTTCRATP